MNDAGTDGAAGTGKAEAEAKIERLKDEERLAIEQLKAAERERQQLEEELKGLWESEKVKISRESKIRRADGSPSGAFEGATED